MQKFLVPIAAIFLSIFSASAVTPASAQGLPSRTWVSGTGSDANNCGRTTPCATFTGAFQKTAPGGEINCIDGGAFGSVTITNAISIICDDVEAGVLVSGTNGIVVNAGANDVVRLSGLDIFGTVTGVEGVRFLAGAALHISKSVVHGFQNGGTSGFGIHVLPSSGTTQVVIENTVVSESGGSSSGAGILVQPSSGATVNAVIKNVQAINDGAGVRFDGTGGPVTGSLYNVTMSGNLRSGLSAVGANSVKVVVDSSSMTGNGIGAAVAGTGATIGLTRSAVTANTTGLVITSGTISSYGDNEIDNNVTDGPAPTPASHH